MAGENKPYDVGSKGSVYTQNITVFPKSTKFWENWLCKKVTHE